MSLSLSLSLSLTHPGLIDRSALVRKHKVAYVACPKPQKGKFSQLIYDEIQSRNPPGRFLKQHPTTKLWHVIGEKKALDKTRQALREGAPDIQKELVVENSPTADQQREQYNQMLHQHSEAYHHVPDLHSSPVKVRTRYGQNILQITLDFVSNDCLRRWPSTCK
jgi:hypothetical protein